MKRQLIDRGIFHLFDLIRRCYENQVAFSRRYRKWTRGVLFLLSADRLFMWPGLLCCNPRGSFAVLLAKTRDYSTICRGAVLDRGLKDVAIIFQQ